MQQNLGEKLNLFNPFLLSCLCQPTRQSQRETRTSASLERGCSQPSSAGCQNTTFFPF